MSIVVIYGHGRSGKTFHRETLRKHYKCFRVVDGWTHGCNKQIHDGDLVLTPIVPPFEIPGAIVVDIETAKREAGLL